MRKIEPEVELHTRPRPMEEMGINIPLDTLASLKRVADHRDMSLRALINFYIGQGLRQDLSRLFAETVLETTAEVLAEHINSQEEVTAILAEIRAKFAR